MTRTFVISSSTASTTTSAKSSTASATATQKPPNPKKGLGYNTVTYTYGFTDVSWVYNWSPSVYGGVLPKWIEFLPMFWGPGSTPNWPQNAQAGINNGATHLLGMNEPDLDSQSNITPSAAATIWKTNMEPFFGKAKLVSPAITNGGAPMGVEWMKEFMGNCTGCHIDAVAMHWYDSATNIGYFENYFTDAAKTFGLPIWVTEFAGYGDVPTQKSFLQTVVPWLDAQPFIERYAAFGDFDGTFVYNNGSLTPLGITYNNA